MTKPLGPETLSPVLQDSLFYGDLLPGYKICTEKEEEASNKVSEAVYRLILDHGIDAVLRGIVKALKKMKDPEYLVFALYLVARRAVREITK